MFNTFLQIKDKDAEIGLLKEEIVSTILAGDFFWVLIFNNFVVHLEQEHVMRQKGERGGVWYNHILD